MIWSSHGKQEKHGTGEANAGDNGSENVDGFLQIIAPVGGIGVDGLRRVMDPQVGISFLLFHGRTSFVFGDISIAKHLSNKADV